MQGTTFVPLRAVCEAFGLEVAWDETTSKVTINSDDVRDESWKENTGEINLDDLTYTGEGISADGTVTVGEEATLITATRSGGAPTLQDMQNAVMLYSDAEHGADDTVSVKDANGTVIAEYTPTGSFRTVFIVSPKFEKDKTYTVTLGDETHEVTMSGGIVTVGETQNGMGGSDGGRPGDRGNRSRQTTQPTDNPEI